MPPFDFLRSVEDLLRSLDEERIACYPTYGYREGDHWRIPLRIWVYEPRERITELVARTAEEVVEALDEGEEIDKAERSNLLDRLADLLADDEGKQRALFRFDGDSEDRDWRIEDAGGGFPRSDANGAIEGSISLPVGRAEELLRRQGSEDGWLTYHAVSRGHTGIGRVRLIPPEGRSVISDIDDTIKVTEIPAGKRTVLRNTFLREFKAAPGMAERYGGLGADVAFHYVSGGPYQLYGPLSRFLQGTAGFPTGSYHMKFVPKNLRSPDSWEQLAKLVFEGDQATFDQKVSQITEILRHFPERRFVLVGDSGECDPEVYWTIARDEALREQIQGIWIRDVVGAAGEARLQRLQGLDGVEVEILPAEEPLAGAGGCEVGG